MKEHFRWLFVGIVLYFASYAPCAYGRTEYEMAERSVDVRMFSEYLDQLRFTSKRDVDFKKISLTYPIWQSIASKTSNKISNLYYSDAGYVVLENKFFNFEIFFYPEFKEKSIVWTCSSVKNHSRSTFSLFLTTCFLWKKEVFYVITAVSCLTSYNK